MADGWLLLTRAEMNAMAQAMKMCQERVDQLEKDVKALEDNKLTPEKLFDLCEKAELMTGAYVGREYQNLQEHGKVAIARALEAYHKTKPKTQGEPNK